MAQSDQEKNDSLINIETDNTNETTEITTIPKKLLLAGEQWSQEENCIADDIQQFNHCHELALPKDQTTQNNNFIGEKSNLSCSDDKYCFYHKFPVKVNNNIYPEVIALKKDGMEEYFEQNAVAQEAGNSRTLNCSSSVKLEKDSGKSDNFHDQINALNGDDDDEDNGCIYTYKGDNYESNLSQLLDTCFSCGLPISVRSAPPCSAVSIQRILNGSSRVKSNQKGSLYSPEMDFLEMDFDPESCGDGADSECEDNNVLNIYDQSAEMQADTSESAKISSKSSNIQNIRSLMCRRCEMCYYNEQKVNNTSDSNINKLAKTEINKGFIGICENESNSQPHQNIGNLESHNNYDCNSFKSKNTNIASNNISLSNCEDNIDKENIENNLNFVEEYEKFSDDGEDADDERDDSVSEHYDAKSCSDRKNSLSTLFSPKEENNCHTPDSYDVPNTSNVNCSTENCNTNGFTVLNSSVDKVFNNSHKINNNLGSISAPEVSPTKEYSCVDKFTRSFSFHNQLSSPKYENVCISNRHKENIPNCCLGRYPDCEGCSCSCSTVSHDLETSNKEACADRLSQRVKSVFNVGALSYNGHVTGSNFKNIDVSSTGDSPVAVTMATNYYMPSVGSSSSTNDGELLPTTENSLPVTTVVTHETDDPNADPNTTKECYDRVPAGLSSTVEKVMIWTEFQAAYRQVVQVDTSACGATAVLNVLLALDQARAVNEVTESVKTRQRAENAPLVEYLLSRSNAGATHEDLIRGVEEISNGSIVSRFFHMYPKRSFQLSRWLSHWIKKGGVPVATLNLQVGVYPRQTVPDAWHHQMVFGVGPLGVYLTNPLECVSVTLLCEQLCSSSVLLVRRADVVSRWDNKDKLIQLSLHADTRWNEMNALGQVVGVLKEETAPEKFQGRRHLTSHVSIPAAYQSGVTIFMRSDNPNVDELKSVQELPFLDE